MSAARTKASRTTLAVVAVFVVVVLTAVGGIVLRIASSSSDSASVRPVNQTAETFPVPADAVISLPPADGTNPASTARYWKVQGTVDQACAQWRELFRGWVDQTGADAVKGEIFPGNSCDFTGPKNGFDTELRVASYAGAQPEAALIVTARS